MTGDVDGLDFVLAEQLGMTLAEVRALPNTEIVEWRAWHVYRTAMRDLQIRAARG